LRVDGRKLERREWQAWLTEAAKLAVRFDQELWGDDPFSYNETASVSLLCAAGSRAGNLCLAEFSTTKKAAHNRRKRAPGRSDFWMLGAAGRSWAFEFKQLTRGSVTMKRLQKKMAEASRCAACIREIEADVAVAGLIVPLFYADPASLPAAHERLERFALECDAAWRLEGAGDDRPEVYLFFNLVRPQ
jgi:hypothetical protein